MEIQSIEPFKFYSDTSVQLLKTALVEMQAQHKQVKEEQRRQQLSTTLSSSSGVRGRVYFSDDDESSSVSSEKSVGEVDRSAPLEENVDADPLMTTKGEDSSSLSTGIRSENLTSATTNNKNKKSSKKKSKKSTEEYLKLMGSPPTETLIIQVQNETNIALALTIPTALFPSNNSLNDANENSNSDLAHFYQSREEEEKNQSHLEPILTLYNLAHGLSLSSSSRSEPKHKKNILVILLQSGRFAAAIFNKDECIKHTTFSRYTVRKGQGGSQSALDNSKGKAKSVGSQLRRAGEAQLRNDVYSTLVDWREDIDNCALYFLSLSKMLQKGFWEDVNKAYQKNMNNDQGLKKGSNQVKSIPLDVGRPCFESCCAVYELIMNCSLLQVDLSMGSSAHTSSNVASSNEVLLHPIKESNYENDIKESTTTEQEIVTREYVGAPLAPLHQAALDGNVEELTMLLSSNNGNNDDIDTVAGPKLMTPLHYAAANANPNAAKCVSLLLIQGRANPSMLDSHNRPPSYLASNDSVRNAFRLARSELGEDVWNWSEGAKVGPPLTNDDIKNKREKAAEKKRRQRMRQKERKKLEQEKAAEEERRAKEEQERKEQEESARRVRAGLKPKSAVTKNSVVCDFCQKDCKGKRKSQLFSRLDFLYCSSECMRKHQRELMAAAATARMSNGT